MQHRGRSQISAILAAAIAGTMLVACGRGETVTIDGSSTVFPITEAVAEEFRAVAADIRVVVGVSGTGGGFQKFCAGETDISNASRRIKESEQAACAEAGIEYLEFIVALDGLAVVTNTATDFLPDGVTIDQLKAIFEPSAERVIKTWNQVDPAWPDQEIQIFAPDTASGTFDFFTDAVVGEEGSSRADYTASSDDNVLVIGISGEPGTLGYFGYAYYIENADRLTVLAVDGVAPNDTTVADGSYPLARPLFIYVKRSSLLDKPHVREFAQFYLSEVTVPLVGEVGYTAAPTEERDAARAAFEAAIVGVEPSARALTPRAGN